MRTKNLRTPLHTACLHGHLDIVKFLLGKNAKLLNQRDSCGLTPFMDAVLGDHLNLVIYLIEHYKVDVNEKDCVENTCIHLAAQAGSLKSLNYLFDLFYPKNNSNCIEMFSNSLNKFKMTPLHSACKVS